MPNPKSPAQSTVRLLREPTDQQLRFINSSAREQLFGGAKRGGKSVAIGMKVFYLSYFFPGNRGLLFRKDFTDLKDTTLDEFFRTVPHDLLDNTFGNGTGHNKGDREIRTKTVKEGVSSTILYRGLGNMTHEDMEKVKSLTTGWIAGDEMSEVPEDQYKMLNGQLTHKLADGSMPPYMALAASNPEPGWVEKKWIREIMLPGHEFIKSLPRDNPHLPPGYEEYLRANYDADWVKKYLDGSWDVVEGQYFQELNPIFHDWPVEFITKDWLKTLKLILTIDHAETGFIVGTVNGFDQWDNQFVLSEWYQQNKLISEACRAMCEMCEEFVDNPESQNWRDRFSYCLIDPETLAKTLEHGQTKQAVIQAYQNGGAGDVHNSQWAIPCAPAWNALELGLQHLKQRLHLNPLHRHPVTGLSPAPHIYICRARCKETWDDFRACRKKMTLMGKARFLGRDHGLDTVRYASNSQIHDPQDPNFLTGDTCMVNMTATDKMILQHHRQWAKEFDKAVQSADDKSESSGSWF